MNKLIQVELIASNRFAKKYVKEFLLATRPIVNKVESRLAVEELNSNYEKACVIFWPAGTKSDFDLPTYEYDDCSSVLIRNVEIDVPHVLNNPEISDHNIWSLAKDNFIKTGKYLFVHLSEREIFENVILK